MIIHLPGRLFRSCVSLALPFVFIAMHAFAGPAGETPSLVVTTTTDIVATDGLTSLREAINFANSNPDTSTITFSGAAFSGPGPFTIQLDSALPTLATNININGLGAKVLTIRGKASSSTSSDWFRIFNIASGTAVSISGLSVLEGKAAGAAGLNGTASGIGGGATTINPPTNGAIGQGGAILNAGTLTVTECTFLSNNASGGAGGIGAGDTNQTGGTGADGQGGAIYSSGPALTIARCTFSGNSANGGGGGAGGSIQFGGGNAGNGANAGAAWGGAIYIAGAGTHSIVNSTFHSDVAGGGYGGSGGVTNFTNGFLRSGGVGGNASGGGIYSTQPITIRSCTFAFCSASAGAGGLQGNYVNAAPGAAFGGGLNANGTITIGNCLIAANTATSPDSGVAQGPDVFGSFVSQSFNLIGVLADATGINGGADQSGTTGTPLAAKLDMLADNGGNTPTLRLRRGSPAVDKGKDLGSTGVDQRGFMRPKDLADTAYANASGGDGSDIGAFESASLPNDVPTTVDQTLYPTQGVMFSGQLAAHDTDGDILTYSLVSGTMPDGLTLNSNGSVTGTPSAPGQSSVTFKVNDGLADSTTVTLTLQISESASLVVNTDIDNSSPYDGLHSLREAISAALNDSGSTPVTFDPAFFSSPKTILLGASAPPFAIFGDLEIRGPAAGVTVSGGDATGVFQIFGGTVSVKDITIANAHLSAFNSGAALVAYNFGTPPTITFTNCTFRDNGGDDMQGGAIGNIGGNITLINCTLAGNKADRASGGSGTAGAIYQNTGSISLFNCTLTKNHSAAGRGGAIVVDGGTLMIGNTIVAGNTADGGSSPDLSGPITSQGYNIFGDISGAALGGITDGNQIGANPGLDPAGLASNGGPTPTIKLMPGSSAIDKGKAFASVTTDQRGQTRPFDDTAITNAGGGDGSDIGAYEVGGAVAPHPIIVVQQPAGENLSNGSSTVTFPSTNVGATSDKVFKIKNVGDADLTGLGITFSGTNASEFSIFSAPTAPVAGPSGSTMFTIRFTPSHASGTGVRHAVLHIANNDTAPNPFDVNLAGNGVDAAPQPIIATDLYTKGGAVPGAGNDTRTPADSILTTLYSPAINSSAVVAFRAKWKSPTMGSGSGIFVNGAILVAAGDPVPNGGGAIFKSFKDPVVDDGGHVAFIATVADGGITSLNDSVVVSNASGTIEVIAQEGQQAPGATGAIFKRFTNVAIKQSSGGVVVVGTVGAGTSLIVPSSSSTVFTATLDGADTSADTGAWWRPGNMGASTALLVREGNPGFAVGDTIKSFQILKASAGSQGHGRGLRGASSALIQIAFTSGRQSIVEAQPGTLTEVAGTDDTLGGAGPLASAQWLKLGLPSSGNSGMNISVLADLKKAIAGVESSNARGIFLSSNSGSTWSALARKGSEVPPGFPSTTYFNSFKDPVNSSTDGGSAFIAAAKGGTVTSTDDSGIWWKPAASSLALVAREGTEPPNAAGTGSGTKWKSFDSLALPGGSTGPLFTSKLTSGTATVSSTNDLAFFGVDSLGSLRALLREGDPLLTKTVKTFSVLKTVGGVAGSTRAFNASGDVVVLVTYATNPSTTSIVKFKIP